MAFTMEPNPDPDLAFRIETAAGLPRAGREVHRRFSVDPEGHFVARDADGEPVGVVSAVVHGDGTRAWIVGLAVLPAAQGHGLGGRLLRHAVAAAEGRGATTVALDAVEEAVGMYAKGGFRERSRVSYWDRDPAAPSFEPSSSSEWSPYPISYSELMEVADYDRARFGTGRARLLAALLADAPHQAFMVYSRRDGRVGGYVLAQERFTGPWVAEDGTAAAVLLAAAERAGAPRAFFVDDGNARAAEVLAAAGYAREPSCVRMVRGAPPERAEEKLFAMSALG